MNGPDVLVVGEALVDLLPRPDGSWRSVPGGSAANVAVALGRLGRRVGLLTCLGRDAAGEAVAAHLAAAGVDLVGDPWVLPRTSSARARVGSDGSATYEFDVDWSPRPLGLDRVRAVHVCSLGAVLTPGADIVADLVRSARETALISYDVNARPALTGTGAPVVQRAERLVSLAHVVKVSDEDVAALWPGAGADVGGGAVRRLLDLGAGAVAMTRGAAGASWEGADGLRVDVPGVPTDVVDTIGAGDTFGAVLLDGLLDLPRPWEGTAVVRAVERAVLAASLNVARQGADPPSADELARAVSGGCGSSWSGPDRSRPVR